MVTDDAYVYRLALAARQKKRRKRRCGPPLPGPSAQPVRLPTDRAYSPAQKQGRRAEEQAQSMLEEAGLCILARNLCCNAGEIDLVAADGNTLVFVEVRQRSSRRFGGAAASVNRQKQQRLVRAAHYFLPAITRRHFGGRPPPCRFDLVCAEPQGLTWLRHVFAE